MTAQETFEAFIGDEVWPFLKQRDFRRSKGTFHHAVGESWEIINLQKSSYSDSDEVHFTANLAVAFKSLTEGGRGWPKGKRPPAHGCRVQQRLGFVLGEHDTWWSVSAGADTESLGDAVRLALERYALPWLVARSSEEAVFQLLADPDRLASEPAHLVPVYKLLAEGAGREDLAASAAKRIIEHEEWLRRRRQNERE